jgi:hypothetical protein
MKHSFLLKLNLLLRYIFTGSLALFTSPSPDSKHQDGGLDLVYQRNFIALCSPFILLRHYARRKQKNAAFSTIVIAEKV